MAFDHETGRRHGSNARRAAGNIDHLRTATALEMMMVWLVRQLVPCGCAGQVDALDGAGSEQHFEVAIHSRQPQLGQRLLRQREDFGR